MSEVPLKLCLSKIVLAINVFWSQFCTRLSVLHALFGESRVTQAELNVARRTADLLHEGGPSRTRVSI